MTRRAIAAAVVAALIGGLAAEAVAFDVDEPQLWIPDLLAGWTLLGAGAVAWRARRARATGWLLIATGCTWFLGVWPATAFWHRGPLVHLLLTYAGWRPRTRRDGAAVGLGYVAALLSGWWANDWAAAALLGGLLLVLALDVVGSRGPERRSRVVALESAALMAAASVGGAVARALVPGDAVLPSLLAYEAAVAAVAILLVTRLPHPSPEGVADLVVQLDPQDSGSLQARLADALGDPTVRVGFWSPAAGAYTDEDGVPVAEPVPGSGHAATRMDRDGQPFALLVHRRDTLSDPRLVAAVAGATVLSDDWLALRRDVDERVQQIAASRRRLLVTSDTERQHLAEELARGPERRLAEIAELVAQLAPGDREGPTVRALEHVHQAREDLAALSAGLYPGELSELGLAGALTQVAARGPLSVEARISVPPLSDELEAAAYFVACEALTNVVKHAAVDRAQLRAEVQEGLLVIEVTDDGRGGADAAGAGLTGLADRVMTLGGTLRIDTVTSGGTRVTAALPLAPAQEEDSG